MNTEKIKLEIEGREFECEVEFDFTPGEPAVTSGPPEFCEPGTADEFDITGLKIWVAKDVYGDLESFQLADIGFLIEDLAEVIVEKLQELG